MPVVSRHGAVRLGELELGRVERVGRVKRVGIGNGGGEREVVDERGEVVAAGEG